MQWFECRSADGSVYIHEERWAAWCQEKCCQTPLPQGQFRFDLILAHPRDQLEHVPVERNPHGFGYGAHDCFYDCADWSTIWGVHDAHLYQTGEQSWRMLVQSGLPEPIWGERVRLLSTSSAIETEPWGQNPSNRFAEFRNQFWRVMPGTRFLHTWTPPIRYPLAECVPERLRNPPRRLRAVWTRDEGPFDTAQLSAEMVASFMASLRNEMDEAWLAEYEAMQERVRAAIGFTNKQPIVIPFGPEYVDFLLGRL